MSGLESIPVRVEEAAHGAARTANLRPLLIQVEQALAKLRDDGRDTVIDLGSMPFSEQDEADLRELLGNGEVSATLDAFGPTLIQETRFAGVWLVEHKDAEQRRLTLHLQITRIPDLLVTPEGDLADSESALRDLNNDFPDAMTGDAQ